MKRPKDRLHRVIVIGATPAGITATNKLGELGIPVTLVDSDSNIDRKLSREEWKLKTGMQLNHAHRPGLIRIFRNPGIKCILPAKVNSVKHNPQGFRVSLTQKQTFVDPERCTLCGRCLEACPVLIGENEKAVTIDSRLSLPGRAVIDKRRIPRCRENCPLGVNAQGYIALAKEGKYVEALELIREKNVLPAICGRICTHPCEENCRRGELDDSVSIRNIKRFLVDYEMENSENNSVKKSSGTAEPRDEKFAVIGSGPSGLAAAAELAGYGCRVTVFEKEEEPGGMLRYGIGPYRLPRNILDLEIDYIRELGVTFQTSSPVDPDKDLDRLKNEFNAVIFCTGTWNDRSLGVPGEELEGVEGCLSFLTRFYRGSVEK
ncbi:MAG: FAD-dependent oxidoreductase, partial [Deltaproteobacteria bacterium]|nr:FAD-dependent oxidoreductase [Deltaproteobacteria bacterium]